MVRELQRPSFWKAVLAEFLGMTIFVFLSTGSATKWTPSGYPADIVQISLTFGLAIATMAQSLGHLSGGHLNPAVTLGLLAGCQVSLLRALLYIASQLLGAVAASALLLGVTPASRNSTLGLNAIIGAGVFNSTARLALFVQARVPMRHEENHRIMTEAISPIRVCYLSTALDYQSAFYPEWYLTIDTLMLNALAEGVTPAQGLGVEIIITFQLVLCVFATTDKRRKDLSGSGPLAIGLSVAIGHLMAIGFTGCGMNPARSFGPAVITGNFKDHWVYWVGPIIGGVTAAFVYDFALTSRFGDLSERLTVLTSGQIQDYDVEGEDDSARMEMKPK